jgi:L-galactose dehydrogenase
LGSVFRDIDEAEGVVTVHTAIDLGINLIDVSPYYGLTRAESVLGKALKEIPRDAYVLSTKVGRYGDAEFDFSAERVTKSVDESLDRLGIDVIDLIQCHDIEFGSLDQVVGETLPALERLREQGKVRYVGITGLPLKIFRYVIERAPVDQILSYCRYSLLDDSLVSLLPFLSERGIGVINASPLSMGLLSTRGAPEWHPAPCEVAEVSRKAAAFCEESGVDIAKLAIQFSVSHKAIASTLSGTASTENIKRNVAWALEEPDAELLRKVGAILAPVHNRTWTSGLPENQDD